MEHAFLKDVIYKSELITWPQQVQNFNTHICLSRETNLTELNAPGVYQHSGYVHEVYKSIFKPNM